MKCHIPFVETWQSLPDIKLIKSLLYFARESSAIRHYETEGASVKRATKAVFFAIVLCCLMSASRVSAQIKVKSHEECIKLVPGDWGPNFGAAWHQHEAAYWGCRLAVSPDVVESWQDPGGMIQDIRLAAISEQEFASVEHLEGSLRCYSFAAFRKAARRWESVWEQGGQDYCVGACPPIEVTVVSSNLVLRAPRSNSRDCKGMGIREEYRWNRATFERVDPQPSAVQAQASSGPNASSAPRKLVPTQPEQKWIAGSTTAMAITGNVTLASNTIIMSHKQFAITLVREIDKRQLYDVGQILDFGQAVPSARLYKTLVTGMSRLMNGNTICGPNEDARWMLVAETPGYLTLAFFSGEREPNLDYNVVRVSHYLCGTYSYISPDKRQ